MWREFICCSMTHATRYCRTPYLLAPLFCTEGVVTYANDKIGHAPTCSPRVARRISAWTTLHSPKLCCRHDRNPFYSGLTLLMWPWENAVPQPCYNCSRSKRVGPRPNDFFLGRSPHNLHFINVVTVRSLVSAEQRIHATLTVGKDMVIVKSKCTLNYYMYIKASFWDEGIVQCRKDPDTCRSVENPFQRQGFLKALVKPNQGVQGSSASCIAQRPSGRSSCRRSSDDGSR